MIWINLILQKRENDMSLNKTRNGICRSPAFLLIIAKSVSVILNIVKNLMRSFLSLRMTPT